MIDEYRVIDGVSEPEVFRLLFKFDILTDEFIRWVSFLWKDKIIHDKEFNNRMFSALKNSNKMLKYNKTKLTNNGKTLYFDVDDDRVLEFSIYTPTETLLRLA